MLIARRAAGEYAIIPNVRKIAEEHRKNRNPEDRVFLEFARLVLQKSYGWDDYERLAKQVLKIIPHPFGPPVERKTPLASAPEQPAKRKKGQRKCGVCSGVGHNSRTCPNKPNTPTMTFDDGIERLTPGYDPNPPG